jgi:hypothetical protein
MCCSVDNERSEDFLWHLKLCILYDFRHLLDALLLSIVYTGPKCGLSLLGTGVKCTDVTGTGVRVTGANCTCVRGTGATGTGVTRTQVPTRNVRKSSTFSFNCSKFFFC